MTLPLALNDLVEDVVREYPATVSVLREWGVVCIQCGEPVWGTLGELIQDKGLAPDPVLAALNAALKSR